MLNCPSAPCPAAPEDTVENTTIRPRFEVFVANLFVDGMAKLLDGQTPSNLEQQAIEEVYHKFMELVMNAMTREAMANVKANRSIPETS